MNATTVAVDVAKNVFGLAVADASWKLTGSARPSSARDRSAVDGKCISEHVPICCSGENVPKC